MKTTGRHRQAGPTGTRPIRVGETGPAPLGAEPAGEQARDRGDGQGLAELGEARRTW